MSDIAEMNDDDIHEDVANESETEAMIRKKQIVEHVSLTTGVKKREVREALDAAFGYIREQLIEGKEIAYPTLGKIKVRVQQPDSENPKTLYRVALAKDAENDDSALAEGEE